MKSVPLRRVLRLELNSGLAVCGPDLARDRAHVRRLRASAPLSDFQRNRMGCAAQPAQPAAARDDDLRPHLLRRHGAGRHPDGAVQGRFRGFEPALAAADGADRLAGAGSGDHAADPDHPGRRLGLVLSP
ncbi:hypothetical protein BOS5A_10578 [Bosea sp. EC-HK365B]|nr:hypothetical protein BOS5A_10578 [Bosea sp. EC-HK365B]